MPFTMRKIRGKELYKVWNTITGEVKSEGSLKKDAKSQLRLLRGIEKKGGSLKADQIKDVVDFSYNNKKDKAPDGYVLDKELSDGRVKVYKDLNSNQVIVAHRGSSGWKDWLDNAYYATTGNIKDSGTYKTHKKKHEKALDKYGAENVISVGHSRAGKYVEELNREQPVKEVLTYNKAVGIHDAFQKNPDNQTDIRSSRDLISGLSPFQSSKNKVVTIPSNTFNFLKAHGTSALSSLGNKLIGKGFKQMRVGDMRKFVKAFKKAKYGETWTGGAKYGKKQLTEMIRPMFEDDDIDELVGGSIWTDFVKDFSSKHGLKYACSLSKYKEPLKKAYRLFKDKKDWFEPMKIDAISGTEPEQPNITLTITEPEPEQPKSKKKPVVLVDDDEVPVYDEKKDTFGNREKLLKSFSGIKLRDFLEKQHGYQAKGGATLSELATEIMLIEAGLPPQISKPISKSGSGILSGGNKWTDFVKDYAKSYNTTYGCALSDVGIKSAYKLFKDGKTWYFPKVSASIETQTDDFIEPTPTEAPVNIEPVVSRIEEKVRELEALGAKKGAVSYDSKTIITDLGFVNMLKKYGGKCVVINIMKTRGVEVGINVNSNKDESDIRFPVYYNRLGEALRDCIQRGIKVIAVPLSLNFGKRSAGHANMLIYRPFKRIVERFEPHGRAYGNSMVDNKSFNDQLKKLWETDLTPFLGKVRYVEPDQLCPDVRGFQTLEGQLKGLPSEGEGFCSMWSFFLAEMTFINPDKSTKEIIDEVFDITKKDPAYLKSLIRGYVVDIEKGLDGLLKIMGKKGFSFAGKGINSPYMTIAGIVPEWEKWLLSVAFDSKSYSEAPPQFEPLPDVVLSQDDKQRLKEEYFKKVAGWTMKVLKDVYALYGMKSNTPKRLDTAWFLIESLAEGDWVDEGATGLEDIDVILKEGLWLRGKDWKVNLAQTGYFLNKKLEREKTGSGVGSGGKINIGKSLSKAFDPKKNGVSKAFEPVSKSFDKAGKSMSEGMYQASQGLNKINPMMIALNDKKTSKLMRQSGEITNDYLLPAVVAMGKPVYDATAMTASTMITGNPIAGKILADALWDNMVANKGIDPRDRQKSELLGIVSSQIGNVLGKASGNIGK